VPFGLFKKKESEAPVELPTMTVPAARTLSIQQAQDLLRDVESAKVQELAARLAPIKESAAESLKVIDGLANDMENEKIKFEGIEHRFKSVAENSRKTIVSSLRREASTELSLPQSANDAKKFKERFETMMNRLGEVSGSHSRVITAFMKKHANKMRSEFDDLKKLLNETKTIMSDFEQKRAPIIKCGGILNTASQKVSSIRSAEASIRNIEQEIGKIENELEGLKGELGALRASPEFEQAAAIVQKTSDAERQQEQLHAQLSDLFSHVSRAFTKYSYGLTKETEARLQMMTDEPWRMLYESDISPYSSLLVEIRKSIDSGKIQLKDSDKILNYLDDILKSLPEFQGKVQALRTEADLLRRSDSGLVGRAGELEERVAQHEEELAKNRQNLEQQKRQVAEKNGEVGVLLKEAGDILADLTGQKYSLEY
jgi:DNA repair exonuclease SbcCD ATPase subunit